MSVHEVTYYQAKCDCCGEIETDYGDYSAWSDPQVAIEHADGYETIDGEDLCSACWCWPEDLPDYPGDEAWTGTDDPVRKHAKHPVTDVEAGRRDGLV